MKYDFVPNHKYRDEKGHLVLSDDYIMSYNYHDGFTSRLLSIDLLIDKNFELSIFHDCIELGNLYCMDGFQFKQIVHEIPLEIFSFLEKLISSEVLSLKDSYDLEEISVDDVSNHLYLFNNDSKTKTIFINGALPLTDEVFTTEIEREFLNFHIFIEDWTNNIYNDYIKNTATNE